MDSPEYETAFAPWEEIVQNKFKFRFYCHRYGNNAQESQNKLHKNTFTVNNRLYHIHTQQMEQ